MIDLSQDKFAPVPLGPILISSIEEVIGKDFTKAAFDPLLLSGMHVGEKDHSLNTLFPVATKTGKRLWSKWGARAHIAPRTHFFQ